MSIVIALTAFVASLLTFFSGFGLGTILTPVFAIFFPIDLAIALTAIVHLLNNLFKISLTGRFIDKSVVFRFGITAIIGAFLGAYLLSQLSNLNPITSYQIGNKTYEITYIKVIISLLMMFFAFMEITPYLKKLEFKPDKLAPGGLISGFFGGLSGHQGALRSAFLIRYGLSKESFIATGIFIACLIDIARLPVYFKKFDLVEIINNLTILSIATLSALVGAYTGSKLIKKVTINSIQNIVAIMLLLLSIAIGMGLV